MGGKSRKHKSYKQKPYRYKPPKRKGKSRKPIILMLALCLVVIVVVAYSMTNQSDPNLNDPSLNKVLLKTSMGDITIQLYDDMPITTENFKKLVQQGVYDGTIFHRVIDGFMIQGGDPMGTGEGDPSIPTIEDELPDHNSNDRSTIAMANAGPNTGSSQFFINLVDNNNLDPKHPVFGKVIEGMNVVDEIGKVETGPQPLPPNEVSRPLQEIRILKAELIN